MNWLEILYFTLSGAILVTMALGVLLACLAPSLDKWNKRYFITLFSLLFLCAVTCFLALLFYNDPEKATMEKVVYFFESLFMSVPVFMPTIFLLHCSREKVKGKALLTAVTALLVAYLAMLVVAQFTDVFYYVTPDNRFFYGPLYALSLLPMALILILNIAGTIRRRKALSKKYFIGLLIYMVPMSVMIMIHMFLSVEVLIVFGVALFALIMYNMILSDNVEEYTRQQRQIANQRASIMVLQMRPHFIYNTMMTIYYLCKQDADKAQQVTLDFTEYLRNNFSAIASENTVPFDDELKHTKAYLAVEKAQHEDNLFMEYDTPHTRFRLPPLTLQPFVENAVKHCLNPDGDPLHIFVKTRLTAAGSEITVENDGSDFNPADDNDQPHIALNNIRQRLNMMCNGSLEIKKRQGGGTSVKVIIPSDRT